MSKPLASFLSSLLCARTERGAQLSRDSGVRSFLSSSSSSRERQSVVPWGTRVQLVHGLTAPETSRPLLPGRLLPEDSRARLRHFHPTVVAHIERWATGVGRTRSSTAPKPPSGTLSGRSTPSGTLRSLRIW